MARTIRFLLILQAVAFGAASLVHAGVLMTGYEHRQASIAEAVIGGVLFVAFLVSLATPAWTRLVGLAAQGFALVGTMVGILTILVGVGPQSTFDVVLHTGFVILLAAGLVLSLGARVPGTPTRV